MIYFNDKPKKTNSKTSNPKKGKIKSFSSANLKGKFNFNLLIVLVPVLIIGLLIIYNQRQIMQQQNLNLQKINQSEQNVRQDCPKCKGHGKHRCNYVKNKTDIFGYDYELICRGGNIYQGYRKHDDSYRNKGVCFRCDGTGEEVCIRCDGYGYIK